MNSPDSGVQRPKKLEQKSHSFMANPNMEEHTPSLSGSEDGLQGASGQADTCGKVS